MKAILPAVAIGALLGLTSVGANAADGTISISGTITNSTCSINGDRAGHHSIPITLPTVSAGSLAAQGQTAGTSAPTDLLFKLTGCTNATKAIVSFENFNNVDQDTGNLLNVTPSENATKNVQVQLLNRKMAPINITTNSNNQLETDGEAITGGNAELQYYARYYATGQVTPGNVLTFASFTMQYQ